MIEADEYDTAFFDKRAKFVHYRPRHLVMTNLEFDHADIYPDLASIQRQFHHLVRTVPASGRIIWNVATTARSLQCSRWDAGRRRLVSRALLPNAEWGVRLLEADGSAFELLHRGAVRRRGALAADRHAQRREWPGSDRLRRQHGRRARPVCGGAGAFAGVRRRLELRGEVRGVPRLRRFRPPSDGGQR